MTNTKKIIYITIGVLAAIALGVVLFYYGGGKIKKGLQYAVKPEEKPKIVTEENLVIPETQKIFGSEGRFLNTGTVAVPLVPQTEGEKVIVAKAILTIKGAYDLANIEVLKWSANAKLVFVKSLGVVDLQGRSSQWQLVFSAQTAPATKKTPAAYKGYEIIIQADKIVSQKEIETTAKGADLPKNFDIRDSNWAIRQLAENPQFQPASMTAINFVYNADAAAWDYVIANSFGNSAVRVR